MPDSQVDILLVCTGNVCRSPLAAQLLDVRLNHVRPDQPHTPRAFRLSSAGTDAHEGAPMTPEAASWSRRLGGDPANHRARRFEPEQARDADLVLTMTREQRALVVAQVPEAVGRSFTLIEFARLLDELRNVEDRFGAEDEPSFADLVAAARRGRGGAPPPHPAELDDIVDPYRRPSSVYERAALGIDAAVRSLARSVAWPPVVR